MGPNSEPRPTDSSEIIDRHFGAIVNILKHKAHAELTRAYTNHVRTYGLENPDHSNEFHFNGKTYSELDAEITASNIVRPKGLKAGPNDMHCSEFVAKFGLPDNTMETILTNF